MFNRLVWNVLAVCANECRFNPDWGSRFHVWQIPLKAYHPLSECKRSLPTHKNSSPVTASVNIFTFDSQPADSVHKNSYPYWTLGHFRSYLLHCYLPLHPVQHFELNLNRDEQTASKKKWLENGESMSQFCFTPMVRPPPIAAQLPLSLLCLGTWGHHCS